MKCETYYKLREFFKHHKSFNTYKVRDNQEAFCFWDGISRYNQNGRVGHPKLMFVCQACMNDNNPEVQKLCLDFKFHSTTYRLRDSIYPCGCAKQRGKTLLQHLDVDDLIGVSKKYSSNILTVKECLGGKGNKRKYIVECNICSLDSELYPYGSLTTTKSNLTTRDSPSCGCNVNKVYLKEWQHEIKVRRICEGKGLIFDGWEGEFKGTNKTRIRLICRYHGLSTNTKIVKLYTKEGGCRDCSQELGNFGYYKSRKHEDDYLYLLAESNNNFLKLGRSFDLKRRVYQHESLSGYKFNIIGVYKDVHENIFKLEQKLLLDTRYFKYLPDNIWEGGYRECRKLDILKHPEIISTFNLKEQPIDQHL